MLTDLLWLIDSMCWLERSLLQGNQGRPIYIHNKFGYFLVSEKAESWEKYNLILLNLCAEFLQSALVLTFKFVIRISSLVLTRKCLRIKLSVGIKFRSDWKLVKLLCPFFKIKSLDRCEVHFNGIFEEQFFVSLESEEIGVSFVLRLGLTSGAVRHWRKKDWYLIILRPLST